jgi:uncharacterized membrane protein YraQ (UPF0718 family)
MGFIITVILLSPAVFVMLAILGVSFSAATGITILFLAIFIPIAVRKYFTDKKLPGGRKGAVLQGIWVLTKQFKFEPTLKKWEEVAVESKKHYFEFKGSNFRSGDFDQRHKQLPAEWSPFSVEGDNLIIESEFFKKGHWTWKIEPGLGLVLTGEMLDSKSQFVFNMKNWL